MPANPARPSAGLAGAGSALVALRAGPDPDPVFLEAVATGFGGGFMPDDDRSPLFAYEATGPNN